MSDNSEEPLIDIARDDAGASQHLRQALQTLRNNGSGDTEFVEQIGSVLSGRASLRDLYDSTAFSRVLNPLTERFAKVVDQLPEDEITRMAEEGERQLQYQPPQPPTAEAEVDDDEYFRDRGSILRDGW